MKCDNCNLLISRIEKIMAILRTQSEIIEKLFKEKSDEQVYKIKLLKNINDML